jgi:hypothetical protein
MTTWSKDELRTIAQADELLVAPLRDDGVTYRATTPIWSVAVGDALYVRSYKGKDGRWYQSALQHKAGRIMAAGVTREVTFEPVVGPVNDRVDDAYRAKYGDSPYVRPMLEEPARSSTLEVRPAG